MAVALIGLMTVWVGIQAFRAKTGKKRGRNGSAGQTLFVSFAFLTVSLISK